MRQEFTANVSHELKTPLTSISGYAELMENGMAQGEDIIRFSSAIHKNADRLLTLINDIIRLAELDSSQLSLEFEEIDLYQQALHCMELLKIYADNHDASNINNKFKGSVYCLLWLLCWELESIARKLRRNSSSHV